MKNITVAIDEGLYRRARMRAAERDTSVSAAVREFLVGFCGVETDFERRKRLERETLASVNAFNGRDRMSRDAIHDRHAIP